MPHPVSVCPEAARLYTLLCSISQLHNATPEVLRGPAIEAEHRSAQWANAREVYQYHIQNCIVCKQAIKEMEDV